MKTTQTSNNSSSSSISRLSSTVEDLPREIIEQILLQLPVKSLLRFKSVSKSWLRLISNHNFINSHLHHSTKQHPLHHHRIPNSTHLMLISSTSLMHSLHLHLPSSTTACTNSQEEEEEAPAVATDEVVVVLEDVVESPVRRSAVKDIKIVGSCNGLLCMVVDAQHMIIYNPSTRHAQQVPNPEETVLGKEYFYGFGCDSLNDDCKIVRATSSSRAGTFVTQLDIFTLKTNAWRTRTKILPYYFMSSLVGTLLNGALHWAVRRGVLNISPGFDSDDYHDRRQFGIVSFDLREETYKEVPLPRDGDKHFSFYGLGVLGGCLSMLHSPHGSDYQVWVMKEYGVEASWSVFTTIPQKLEDSKEYIGLMSLLCVLKNGEILMMLHNHKKVVIYNPGGRKFRTIFIGEIGSSQAALYLETLVSPNLYAPTSSSPCILAT